MASSPEDSARDLLKRLTRSTREGKAISNSSGTSVDLHQLLEMLTLGYDEAPQLFDPEGRRVVGELDRHHRIVRVSDDLPPRARTFTIAHEIGHHELHFGVLHHRDPPSFVFGRQVGRPRESEANRFAIELLLPATSFRLAFSERFPEPLVLGALSDDQIYQLGLGNQRKLTREDVEHAGLPRLALLAATCTYGGHDSLYHAFPVSKDALSRRLMELGLVRARQPTGAKRTRLVSSEIFLPIASPSKVNARPVASAQAAGLSPNRKSVALLGNVWEHWKNHNLLRGRGWTPIEDNSANAVDNLRADPPCGVVVHSSFWKELSPLQREQAFRGLIELSSFVFVRVDLSGASELALNAVAKLPPGLVAERCVGAFRQTNDSQLDDADMEALDEVFELRHKATRIVVQSDDSLDCPMSTLLKLIVAERSLAGPSPQDAVATVQRLSRGKSGASTYVFSTSDGSHPIFVKIGDVRTLAAELERTRRCEPHIPSLAVPQLRFHGSLGALAQPLISADGTSARPAPSLEDFLQTLDDSSDQPALFLDEILPSALNAFGCLARQRTNDKCRHLDCIARAYASDRQRPLNWIDSPIPTKAIDDLAARALETLMKYEQVALVHGDAHLRNILLRNGTESVLIDFANAGPGHPMFDFVRFELGLWTVLLRQTDRKVAQAVVTLLMARETIDLQLMQTLKGEGLAVDVLLRSSIMIRESCRAIVSADPCWFEQYRSMHSLLALLALRSPRDQYLSFAVFSSVAPSAQPKAAGSGVSIGPMAVGP